MQSSGLAQSPSTAYTTPRARGCGTEANRAPRCHTLHSWVCQGTDAKVTALMKKGHKPTRCWFCRQDMGDPWLRHSCTPSPELLSGSAGVQGGYGDLHLGEREEGREEKETDRQTAWDAENGESVFFSSFLYWIGSEEWARAC